MCGGETKSESVLGHPAAAAAAGAPEGVVAGVPCRPWYPWAPS